MARTMKNNKKEMTLLQAIERVVELSEDSKMSKEFMKKAKAEIQLLAKSYGITERQAVLFCVCMEKGPRRVEYDDLASYLDINKISALGFASDIDALVRRRAAEIPRREGRGRFRHPHSRHPLPEAQRGVPNAPAHRTRLCRTVRTALPVV